MYAFARAIVFAILGIFHSSFNAVQQAYELRKLIRCKKIHQAMAITTKIGASLKIVVDAFIQNRQSRY